MFDQFLTFDLIVSQGHIGDKSAHTLEGAALIAGAIERHYGARAAPVGSAGQPGVGDWRTCLDQAHETLSGLAQAVRSSVKGGNLPLLVANTCSASLASLPVLARYHPDSVVLWIDAHGDFNTPQTTLTGYLGGMVLAAACGLWDSGHGAGLRPEQVILVGARDIDPEENALLKKAGVQVITPQDATPERLLKFIQGSRVWLHVDWDVLEPGFVPADYNVPDGLLPAQLRAIFEALLPTQILGVELAEFHAPADRASRDAALSIILDTIAPLFDTERTARRRTPAEVGG